MSIQINIFLGVFLAATAGTTLAETVLSPLIRNIWAEFFDNRKRKNSDKIKLADSTRAIIVEGKNKKWCHRYRDPEHFTYLIEEGSLLAPGIPQLLKKLREKWDEQSGNQIDIQNSGEINSQIEITMQKRERELEKIHEKIKNILDSFR